MESQVFSDEQFQLREFQCPVCLKHFSRKFTLDMHLLIHKGVKPHPCPFCGKCFRQKGTLMRHKALHSSSNLFHCKLCNRGFRQKNVFLYHLKHRHNVTTETLDRRKYRTELKDHKSIMDTLPSFVQADSTAIASSEKQLDAMLFESLSNNTGGLGGVVKVKENAEKILLEKQHPLSMEPENKSDKHFIELGNHISMESLGYECGLCLKYFPDYVSFKHHIEKDHNNNEMLYDTKPIEISKVISYSNQLGCSPKPDTNDLGACKNVSNSSTVNEVLNPNDINEDVNLCVICQKSFETRQDFETHISIHVRNTQSTETAERNQFVLSDSTILSKLENSTENTFHFVSSTSDEENKSIDKVLQTFCEGSNNPQMDLMVSNSQDELNQNSSIKLSKKNKIAKQDKLLNPDFNLKRLKNPKQTFKVLKGKSHIFKSNSPNMLGKYGKNYKCKLCFRHFQNTYSFEYHKQLHLNSKGFNCGLCNKYFISKSLLLSHTRLSHMRNFHCSSCSKIFQYKTLYLQHIKLCCNSSSPFKSFKDLSLPIISIDDVLKSESSGILGIIPLSHSESPDEDKKFCIPIISLAAVKNKTAMIYLNSFMKISDLQK